MDLTELEKALDTTIALDSALRPIRKQFPYLRGLAGELLVMIELKRLGIEFTPKTIASKFDIMLKNHPRPKVEVKTSTIKPTWSVPGYGWTVVRKNQLKDPDSFVPSFDYLVCVGFDDVANCRHTSTFFVFDSNEIGPYLVKAMKEGNQNLGYVKSVGVALSVCKNKENWTRCQNSTAIPLERHVNENHDRYSSKEAWDVFKSRS